MTIENPSRSQSLKQAAANIPAAFHLVWEAHRDATIVMALLTVNGALNYGGNNPRMAIRVVPAAPWPASTIRQV